MDVKVAAKPKPDLSQAESAVTAQEPVPMAYSKDKPEGIIRYA